MKSIHTDEQDVPVSVVAHSGMTMGDAPCWEPLAQINTALLPEFMYMGFYDAEHHIRIHAYKHIDTRRYLHVDNLGGLWCYNHAPSKIAELETPPGERTAHFTRAPQDTIARVLEKPYSDPEDVA